MTTPPADPDWRDQAYATFDKVMRGFLDNLYKDQIAPAMIEAGMDSDQYRLEFAPLNPVEALHAEVMIKGEAYVSVPAEVTTDIAADTETSAFTAPADGWYRYSPETPSCKCEPQKLGVVINNQIMCGTCGRNTNLRIPDDCSWCSLENYSRAVNCMGPAKAAAAFTRHVIRAHHPQLAGADNHA